jgi:hypothetical protein
MFEINALTLKQESGLKILLEFRRYSPYRAPKKGRTKIIQINRTQ